MVFHESELDWIKTRQDVVELRKAIRELSDGGLVIVFSGGRNHCNTMLLQMADEAYHMADTDYKAMELKDIKQRWTSKEKIVKQAKINAALKKVKDAIDEANDVCDSVESFGRLKDVLEIQRNVMDFRIWKSR